MTEKQIKQKVMNKLKGDRKLKCPFCNNDGFKRVETCFCDIWDRGEDGIVDEDCSGHDYEFFCSKCKKKISEEKLI